MKTAILLGAGFSAPMGYPIGNQLNESILGLKGTEFGFSTDGKLVVDSEKGGRPDFGYRNSYDNQFDFLLELLKYYHSRIKTFDYEEFYDFLSDEKQWEILTGDFEQDAKKYYNQIYSSPKDLISNIKPIFNQIVGQFLKDRNGERWYGNAPHQCKPIFPGYTGFLNCLEDWGRNGIVDIHTLNHDLLLERLSISDWIQGNICDGFEEMGSPYFGKLRTDLDSYMVRLERYTGLYTSNFRLYKLHGSVNYYPFYRNEGNVAIPEIYVKTKMGIGSNNLYKEFSDKNGDLKYDHCWINYHSDFLSGTSSKILRYREPLLFEPLFNKLKENLNAADKLVIIGYGCKDEEINRIIIENFDFKSKPSFMVNPYPSDVVLGFAKQLDSKQVSENLGQMKI
ncbi:SIR2 family protein [Cyclobacterium marinum]|uniref:SIR2 family protein n=1 Tax=Cyclobacterium marinum TaxID=104 RepID=UPI0011EEEAD7|nr:SIR2 family protein [Cyclobacterium marinum]MBI0397975.1 SIR2 family protein [Cyclobacterium marinum]